MAKPSEKPWRDQPARHGPQGEYKRSNDGFIDSERGETQPADKGQAQRSSGDVKPEDQPPSPGQPAGGDSPPPRSGLRGAGKSEEIE